MAGIALSLSLDDADADGALAALADAGTDLSPLMWDIGAVLETSARRRIAITNAGPDGAPWPPSRAAQEEGRRTLEQSGRLRDSIESQPERDQVTVGSNVLYARIHQLGGEIRPKKGKALAFGGRLVAKVTMPARPYLGVSTDDAADIRAITIEYLDDAAQGQRP